jgi:hypothetical protein
MKGKKESRRVVKENYEKGHSLTMTIFFSPDSKFIAGSSHAGETRMDVPIHRLKSHISDSLVALSRQTSGID